MSKRPANPYQTIADRAAVRRQHHGCWTVSERNLRSGDSKVTPTGKPFIINPRLRTDMVRSFAYQIGSFRSVRAILDQGNGDDPIRIGSVPPGNGITLDQANIRQPRESGLVTDAGTLACQASLR